MKMMKRYHPLCLTHFGKENTVDRNHLRQESQAKQCFQLSRAQHNESLGWLTMGASFGTFFGSRVVSISLQNSTYHSQEIPPSWKVFRFQRLLGGESLCFVQSLLWLDDSWYHTQFDIQRTASDWLCGWWSSHLLDWTSTLNSQRYFNLCPSLLLFALLLSHPVSFLARPTLDALF